MRLKRLTRFLDTGVLPPLHCFNLRPTNRTRYLQGFRGLAPQSVSFL